MSAPCAQSAALGAVPSTVALYSSNGVSPSASRTCVSTSARDSSASATSRLPAYSARCRAVQPLSPSARLQFTEGCVSKSARNSPAIGSSLAAKRCSTVRPKWSRRFTSAGAHGPGAEPALVPNDAGDRFAARALGSPRTASELPFHIYARTRRKRVRSRTCQQSSRLGTDSMLPPRSGSSRAARLAAPCASPPHTRGPGPRYACVTQRTGHTARAAQMTV